jgi:hypothetical protein
MPAPMRRSRLVALLLLLLTPGLGGWAVQSVHSCPTAHAATSHAPGEQGHHDAPTHGGHGPDCRCIGSCHAPAVVWLTPAATLNVVVVAAAPVPHYPAGARLLPDLQPSDRLPPSTAPPLG